MNRIGSILREIKELPIHEYAFLRPDEVVFSDEVRRLCEDNACGQYGKFWACPPAVGSVADCKSRCLKYAHVFMFTTVNNLNSQYDIKGWISAQKIHEEVTDAVVDVFRKYDKNLLALSTEGCTLCNTCTFPDAACRQPDRMYPATEGYGILVVKQARNCNIKYYNGINTVTYFSMVFFN